MADENESTNENTDSTKRNTESVKENNKAKEEALKIAKKLVEMQEKENDAATRRDILEMEYLDRIGKSNAAREAAMNLIEKVNRQQEALTATQHQLVEAEENLRNARDPEEQEKYRKQIEEFNKSVEQSTKFIQDNAAELKSAENMLKKHGEISKNDQKTVDSLTKTFESMTMGLISATAAENHMITKSGLLIAELMKADDITQVISESFGAVFNAANISAEVFDTVKDATIKMVTEFDNAAAQFSKTTGLAREYSSVLEQTQRAGSQFSVSAKDSGDAMASLLAEFSDFHKTAPAVQKDLTLNVAQLSKFGVSAQESAKLMQNFNKIMGMSGKEAVETSKKIGMMGTQIGISTSKMLKDYTASLKTLAVYGDKSIKVFTGIAAAAKAAGVETGTLLGMVEKFDTFAGAAEGAGKLNSILGSQISATEMLMMTEDERLKTMISTMQATGQSFASMDKFTQKAIAGAAGISDMAEANKIFGMSMSEFENYEMQMNQANKTQERFEEALKSMQPFMEKLSVLAQQFASAFLPVLEALIVPLDWMISAFAYLNEKSGGWFGTIVGGVAGVYLFAKAVGILNLEFVKSLGLKAKDLLASAAKRGAQMLGIGVTNAETAAEELNNKAKKNGIEIQNKANKAASSGIVPMLALGAAVAMIGGGIYLAATGLAEFVKAFAGLNSDQLEMAGLALLGFGLAVAGLAATMALLAYTGLGQVAIGILLGFGAAFLMIGKGINLAATGMATFIESLSKISDYKQALSFLTGVKDMAISVTMDERLSSIRKFMNELKDADIKAELENIALITTGTSSSLMTKSAVSQLITVASLADQIKNIFNADIVINIDGDAMDALIEKGVYKTSMGNK